MINWAGWVDVGRGFREFGLVVVLLMRIESYVVGLIMAGFQESILCLLDIVLACPGRFRLQCRLTGSRPNKDTDVIIG